MKNEDDIDKEFISSPHIFYKPSVVVSRDSIIDETLKKNPNSKDINVVLPESVMSLLIDIDGNNQWRKNFYIPFMLKPNPKSSSGHNILFMDEPCLDHQWKRRYANHTYYCHVFRSYLAQQSMKHDMNDYEQHLDDMDIQKLLKRQNEWNELMKHQSNNPFFVYSMWKLNAFHCLIRTQIYGQSKQCCFGTVKLDYLNPNKQAFISHHNMKESSTDNNVSPHSLRHAESTLYGVEKLTDSERLQLFIQTSLRKNNRLIIGRMRIPSRKLISCNVIDHNTLLIDESEHVHLHNRYNNALYLIDALFKYLLNECQCDVNKQYVLVYNHHNDQINIFSQSKHDTIVEDKNAKQQYLDFDAMIESLGNLDPFSMEYIAPYSMSYRGVLSKCHIPNLAPPNTDTLPKPCHMFLFHGFCPIVHGDKEKTKEDDKYEVDDGEEGHGEHYRTHILNHCWEYALNNCQRGKKCEWPHLRKQELIDKGYEMFHVRQLINYCQDYYKHGRCKNTQNGGRCDFVHFNESQLMLQFHTKYKDKQMKKYKLMEKALALQKNLELVQNNKFPGQQRRRKNTKKAKTKQKKKKDKTTTVPITI